MIKTLNYREIAWLFVFAYKLMIFNFFVPAVGFSTTYL